MGLKSIKQHGSAVLKLIKNLIYSWEPFENKLCRYCLPQMNASENGWVSYLNPTCKG